MKSGLQGEKPFVSWRTYFIFAYWLFFLAETLRAWKCPLLPNNLSIYSRQVNCYWQCTSTTFHAANCWHVTLTSGVGGETYQFPEYKDGPDSSSGWAADWRCLLGRWRFKGCQQAILHGDTELTTCLKETFYHWCICCQQLFHILFCLSLH